LRTRFIAYLVYPSPLSIPRAMHLPGPEMQCDRIGGHDHKPLFRAICTWNPEEFSREGLGHSKLEARRAAALAIASLLEAQSICPDVFRGEASFWEDRVPGGRGVPSAPIAGPVVQRLYSPAVAFPAMPKQTFEPAHMTHEGTLAHMPHMPFPISHPEMYTHPPYQQTQLGILEGERSPGPQLKLQQQLYELRDDARAQLQPMQVSHAPQQEHHPQLMSFLLQLQQNQIYSQYLQSLQVSQQQQHQQHMLSSQNSERPHCLQPKLEPGTMPISPSEDEALGLNSTSAEASAVQNDLQTLPRPDVDGTLHQEADLLQQPDQTKISGCLPESGPTLTGRAAGPPLTTSSPDLIPLSNHSPLKTPAAGLGGPPSHLPSAQAEPRLEAAGLPVSDARQVLETSAEVPLAPNRVEDVVLPPKKQSSRGDSFMPGEEADEFEETEGWDKLKGLCNTQQDTLSTRKPMSDVDPGTCGYGDVPGIAIHRKRPAQTADTLPAGAPGSDAVEQKQQVRRFTVLLYVHIDELPAIEATVALAGSQPADVLDLQVRAFGVHRAHPSSTDHLIPTWMNVTRIAAHSSLHAVHLAMAVSAGRDSLLLEQTEGGRAAIVTCKSDFETFHVFGYVDVVTPVRLLEHLQSFAALVSKSANENLRCT
jgi:hypothetical protein